MVGELARRGAQGRVLGRVPRSGGLPTGAELVTGDGLDIDVTCGLLRILRCGVLGARGVADRIADRLGRPLRTYRSPAGQTVASRA